jgi:hypothetical protein
MGGGRLDYLTYAVWVVLFLGGAVLFCLHGEHVHISRFTHIYSIRLERSVLFCSVKPRRRCSRRTRPVLPFSSNLHSLTQNNKEKNHNRSPLMQSP